MSASAEDEGDLARYAEFVPDIYLTRAEAARRVGLRQAYFERLVVSGRGPAVCRVERAAWFFVSEPVLLAWAREQGWQGEAAD